jgi:hypothetical protein
MRIAGNLPTIPGTRELARTPREITLRTWLDWMGSENLGTPKKIHLKDLPSDIELTAHMDELVA